MENTGDFNLDLGRMVLIAAPAARDGSSGQGGGGGVFKLHKKGGNIAHKCLSWDYNKGGAYCSQRPHTSIQ